jgi:hypothetical protein
VSALQEFSAALGFYLGHAPYSSNISHLRALPICCSQCVPIKVSLGSQHVLSSSQCVPRQAPHSSSLYPIILCPKFYSCKLYKWRSHNIFILGLSKAWFKFKFIFLWRANQWCPSQKKKLWSWGSPQLIFWFQENGKKKCQKFNMFCENTKFESYI